MDPTAKMKSEISSNEEKKKSWSCSYLEDNLGQHQDSVYTVDPGDSLTSHSWIPVQITHGPPERSSSNGFTLQIWRAPQAGSTRAGGLCAACLPTLICRRRLFNSAEVSSRAKLRRGSSHAASSAIMSCLRGWTANNKVLSARRYYVAKREKACPSGKSGCPSDQNSTCRAPAITRVVTEATRVTVASAHQALAFNYGLHESPNPRRKLYIKKEVNTENKQQRRRGAPGKARVG